MRKDTILLLVFMVTIPWSSSQDISVKIDLDREQIYYGERVQLQVTVSGGDGTTKIDTSALTKNFTVKSSGNQSLNRSSIQIINGRVYKEEFIGHVFGYILIPEKSGTFTVGPLKATYQGKKLTSNSLILKVIGPEKSDQAFIKITTAHAEYLLGEAFTVFVDIYLKRLQGNLANHDPMFPGNPPKIHIPWLEESLSGLQGPSAAEILRPYLGRRNRAGFSINEFAVRDDDFFSFFDTRTAAVFRLPRKKVKAVSPTGSKNSYFRYRLQFRFTGKQLGLYHFNPVVLKGVIATRTIDDNNAQSQNIVVVGKPLIVKVIEPPTEGRPAIFCGAIGDFTIKASIIPNHGYVGDPMTLVLSIRGQGEFANILPPKLSQQQSLTKLFKVYDDTVATEQKSNEKIFRYTIRPLQEGIDKVPAINFCYYATDQRAYQIIQTKPLPIVVKAVESVKESEIVSGVDKKKTQKAMAQEGKGIFANYQGLDGIVSIERGWKNWHWLWLLLWPCAYILLWGWFTYYRTLGIDIAYQRRKRALRRAQESLCNATSADIPQFYRVLCLALIGQVADYDNIPESGLVSAEIIDILKKHEIADTLIAEVKKFLQYCEGVQYGANATQTPEKLEQDRNRALQLSKSLQKAIS